MFAKQGLQYKQLASKLEVLSTMTTRSPSSRILLKQAKQPSLLSLSLARSSLLKSAPKRGFSSFDRNLNKLLERLPQGNVGYAVVGLNTLFYGLYLMWPRYNMFSFMNNFTFTLYGLHQGYIHNLVTSHFTHMSFFSYLLDSVIVFLFCQNLGMMFGPAFVAKTVGLSILMGSAFVFAH